MRESGVRETLGMPKVYRRARRYSAASPRPSTSASPARMTAFIKFHTVSSITAPVRAKPSMRANAVGTSVFAVHELLSTLMRCV